MALVNTELAVVGGLISVAQSVLGPDSLMPIAWVAGGISAVASGAAISAWAIRGHLDRIDRRFEKVEERLGTIESIVDRRKTPRTEG